METIKIKTPATQEELEQYYDLRWKVLRAPWKQPKGSEKDDKEDISHHVIAVNDDNRVVGTGRVHFNEENEAQIRFMAIEDPHSGRSLGRRILNTLEEHARKNKAKCIVLNAREKAVGFYARCGYKAIGEGNTIYGEIRHKQMKKFI
jgi:N-acetylglutamate synthase-like GNAT family acetyltransferase